MARLPRKEHQQLSLRTLEDLPLLALRPAHQEQAKPLGLPNHIPLDKLQMDKIQ
jgi:hypothetical protein